MTRLIGSIEAESAGYLASLVITPRDGRDSYEATLAVHEHGAFVVDTDLPQAAESRSKISALIEGINELLKEER